MREPIGETPVRNLGPSGTWIEWCPRTAAQREQRRKS